MVSGQICFDSVAITVTIIFLDTNASFVAATLEIGLMFGLLVINLASHVVLIKSLQIFVDFSRIYQPAQLVLVSCLFAWITDKLDAQFQTN